MSHDNAKQVLLLPCSPEPHISTGRAENRQPPLEEHHRELGFFLGTHPPWGFIAGCFILQEPPRLPVSLVGTTHAGCGTQPSPASRPPASRRASTPLPEPFIRNTQSRNVASGICYTALRTYHLYFTAGNLSDFTGKWLLKTPLRPMGRNRCARWERGWREHFQVQDGPAPMSGCPSQPQPLLTHPPLARRCWRVGEGSSAVRE